MALSQSRKIILLVLLFANVVSTSVTNIYIPSLPQIALDLDVSSFIAQSTVSMHMFGSFLGRIFWGPLSDSYGRRFVLVRALIISLIGLMGCCLAQNVLTLFIFRAVQAVGSGVVLIMSMVIVSDITTGAKRARNLGFIEISWPISWICAPILGSFLCSVGGWRVNFLFLFIMQLFSLIMIYFCIPETLQKRSKQWSVKESLVRYRRLLTNRGFVTFAFMPGFILSGYMIFAVSAPFLYTEQFNFSLNEFAFIQAFPLFISFCMTLGYRIIVKKFGESFGLKLGIWLYGFFAILNILMMVNALPINAHTLLFAICIQCLGSSCLIPASSSLALNKAPNNASGTAASVISLMRNLILSICLTFGGIISSGGQAKQLLISISITVFIVFLLLTLKITAVDGQASDLFKKNK